MAVDNDNEVLLERVGAVATLTLNTPERRNVLSATMVRSIHAAMDDAEQDPQVRAVVLTGTGSAFCAGAELSTLDQAAEGQFDQVSQVYEGFLRVLRSPLPTIAAVNGPAVGAGLNLALACDVRLASTSARFDSRFAALRLHPGGGHTWLLTRAVGPQLAMLASLFGDIWDADQAREIGLGCAVHAPDELVIAAVELGARLSGHCREYVRRAVATLRQASNGSSSHEQLLAAETIAQQWSAQQPEFLDGVAAIRARIAQSQK